MKIVTRTKCRTISARTSKEFDRKFNEATMELEDVELRWDTAPNTVHLLYTVTEKIAEIVKEEYEEILGERYYCKDCPYFKRGKNKRCGSQGCEKEVDRNAVDYTPACELFYKELAQGKIKPRG